MTILILGGSASGKSAIAEDMLSRLAGNGKKAYIATMRVYDDEGKERVKRHRAMRADKGFFTVEAPEGISQAQGDEIYGADCLLECVSNLAANIVFSDDFDESYIFRMNEAERRDWKKKKAERILNEIRFIKEQAENLVIVSNNVFEGGKAYEGLTLDYIDILGEVNVRLATESDEVYEAVASIPMRIDFRHRAKERNAMELYIGGCAQGKLEYVKVQKKKDNFKVIYEPCKGQDADKQTLIWDDYEKWFYNKMKACENPESETLEFIKKLDFDAISLCIICDEVGSGVVPIEPLEREYRERLGRMQCMLAARAERAERIVCGIRQRIK